MGGKRKREDEEEIKRKIKKLESKLQRSRCRSRIIYSSEDETDDDAHSAANSEASSPERDHVESTVDAAAVSPPQPRAPDTTRQPRAPDTTPQPRAPDTTPQPSGQPPTQQQPPRPSSPPAGPSSAPDGPVIEPQVLALSPEHPPLDNDILELLGDAPKPEMALGNSIHNDIASRWHGILLKGLQKEVKDKLLQEYLVPSNCSLLIAPALNPEARAALADGLVKRDHSIMQKQQQLGLALAALAQALESLVKQDASITQKIFKPVSDACRILCDSHYLETKTRRYFVTTSINTSLKDTLSDTVRDNFLFGENVTEKLKAAQTIQKSGDSLKNTPKSFNNRFNKNNFVLNKPKSQKKHFNFKTSHPRTQNKPDARNFRSSPRSRHRSSSNRRRQSSPRRRPYTK